LGRGCTSFPGSALFAVAVLISPLGQEVIHNLSSGEALSRSIASFVATVIACGAVLLAVIEVGIRALIRRRRRASAGSAKS